MIPAGRPGGDRSTVCIAQGDGIACAEASDRGHGHPGGGSIGDEGGRSLGCDGCQHLVVVTGKYRPFGSARIALPYTGKRRGDRQRRPARRRPRRRTPGTCARGPSTGRRTGPWPRRHAPAGPHAGRAAAPAADSGRRAGRASTGDSCHRAASPASRRKMQPERGIAERPGDDDDIAGLGARAQHHPPCRHRTDHGRRDRDRPWPAVGIATSQVMPNASCAAASPAAKRAIQSRCGASGNASDIR